MRRVALSTVPASESGAHKSIDRLSGIVPDRNATAQIVGCRSNTTIVVLAAAPGRRGFQAVESAGGGRRIFLCGIGTRSPRASLLRIFKRTDFRPPGLPGCTPTRAGGSRIRMTPPRQNNLTGTFETVFSAQPPKGAPIPALFFQHINTHKENMSDNNLDIRARLTAVNELSPVLKRVVSDLQKFEGVAERVNVQLAGMGRAGTSAIDSFNRASKSAADQMRGLGNIAERVASSYKSAWAKADQDRERAASRMYSSLMRDERQYQALVARRSRPSNTAGTSPRGSGPSMGRIAGGTFLGVGAASAVRQLGKDVVAMERNIGRGLASAFRERLKISKAETQAEMFGDLSRDEIRKLRRGSLDRLGIKFGVGTEGALGVATELGKAGIGKKVLDDATELALKAKAAMDISAKQTAELFGGLASFIAFDKAKYAAISNSIAVANKDTKASGTDIIEGMKRGLSAISTTGGKLTPEQLAGLVGTAIDVGIQPGKSGTFISHLVGAVASADTAHGQKANDTQEAASRLGFGGRAQMAQAMRSDPMEALYKIFDGLEKLPEKLRIRVAKDLGGEQWFDEILQMVLAKDKLRQVEKDIATDKGFLDKAALKAIRSFSGARDSVVAAAKLAQEKIGGGFDKAWMQISDAILRHADTFDFDQITSHFEALGDGLLQGFGLRNWGEAVDWLVARFDSGTIETWKSWGRGFASGIKSWGESLLSAFSIIKKITGTGNDPESVGKLTANLTALATSLVVLSPLLTVLGAVTLGLTGLGNALAYIAGLPAVVALLSAFAVRHQNDGVPDANVKQPGESTSQWRERQRNHRSNLYRKSSYTGSTDFSGSLDGADAARKVTGSISSKATALSGGSLDKASFEKKFAGTPLAGSYDKIVSAANANGIPPALLAGVIAHETGNGSNVKWNNVAGLMNPETNSKTKLAYPNIDAGIDAAGRVVAKNYRASGGDLDKMGSIYAPPDAANDPRGLNGGWAAGVRKQMNALGDGAGYASTGDAVAWAQKYIGLNEYTDSRVLAAALGGDVRGKSNAWCARFVNKAIEAAGGKGTGSAVANSFQRYGSAIDPAKVMRNDVLLQPNGRGYNRPGGHVGLATGEIRMHSGRLKVKMLAGNDGDSVREHWIDADHNLMVRRGRAGLGVDVPQGVTSQVPPASVIQNVPSPSSLGVGGCAGAGDVRSMGPVAIHINGSSHDPEALATLVQRRIDESMNWRIHDTPSEYA